MSSREALPLLRSAFGFEGFRPGQAEALERLLAGHHTLVVMRTGAGKSLIYQLAALMSPGLTVVISPLIALMKDQVDGLIARNLPATLINSTLPQSEQQHRLQKMRQGAFRMVYVSPERLRSRAFVQALTEVRVELLAVDEAHCISQWGHDFRPDYLHIGPFRRLMGLPTTAALTATATPQVQADIIAQLGLENAQKVITGFNRANLAFDVRYTPDPADKLRALSTLLSESQGPGIVYVGTRRDAEEVAEFIQQELGLAARYYHAGLPGEQRSAVQEAFMAGTLPLVVATNAFGMGVDRADLRFVIHFALPGTLEAYYQEAGRAGRDGLPARCTLLFSPQDRALQEWFIDNDTVDAAEVRQLHALLARQAAAKPALADTVDLALATGMRDTTLRLALSLLERAGALQRLGDEGTRLWVQTATLREAALSTALQHTEQRQRHKRQQLAQMIAYAEGDTCRRRAILAHFGDTGPGEALDCCDICRAQAGLGERARPAEAPAEMAALTALAAVGELRWNVGRKLLAQILKGSASQAVTAKGYHRLKHHGKLAAMRLQEIEALIGELVRTGHLKVIGSDRPLVQISSKGRRALADRTAIPVSTAPPVRAGQARRAYRGHEAGESVALTGRLLAQGLAPAQIAVQRSLTLNTIYEHAAELIATGKASLGQVVPPAVQDRVRQAMAKAGSTDRLAPIKALLPEQISYGEIRCVVAASRSQVPALPARAVVGHTAAPEREAVFEALRSWRLQVAGEQDIPAYCVFHDSALQEIARRLPGTLEELRAIKNVGPAKLAAYGSAVLEVLAGCRDTGSQSAAIASPSAGSPASQPPAGGDEDLPVPLGQPADSPGAAPQAGPNGVDQFLSRPHPRSVTGSWAAGYALDLHSSFAGGNWTRSEMGELAYRLKYGNELHLAGQLARRLARFIGAHPELLPLDVIAPVPPSLGQRRSQPVWLLAEALSREIGVPACCDLLVKTRETRPQKEITNLAQKRANVAGAFAVPQKQDVRGKRVLVLDDLLDSGMTLHEVARVLTQAGATRVVVLVLTKTIHADE